MEGESLSFGCDAMGICNTFTVLWFGYSNEGSIRMNGSGHISQSEWYSDKYHIITSDPQATANGHCNIGSTLTIHRFNYSDNGYYWCQIVSNNSCLLQPSPSEYAAINEIMNGNSMICKFERQLPTPACAEEATPISEEIRCSSGALNSALNIMPTVTLGSHSTYVYNTSSTTATSTVTLLEIPFDRKQNIMLWAYGIMSVFLLAIIVLVLSLVIVSIKCRIQQKQSKHNTVIV